MKFKNFSLVFLCLALCVLLTSCRYINPFSWIDQRNMIGKNGDFFISESNGDIMLQAVTPIGLSRNSIVIPEFCTIEGQTYRITKFDYDAFNGWKYLKEVTVDNTSFRFGSDGFCNNTSLEKIIITSKVPVSNIIVNDCFLPYTDAPDIYLENPEIKQILSTKAIQGADKHNIYFKNDNGNYELFSAAYFVEDSNADIIFSIVDFASYFCMALFLIIISTKILRTSNQSIEISEKSDKENYKEHNKLLLQKYGLVTGIIYALGSVIIKFLTFDFSPFVYGISFLLPLSLIYFAVSSYVIKEKNNNYVKACYIILSIISFVYACAKYFVLGHYSLNTALVIQTLFALVSTYILASKIKTKFYFALYIIFTSFIVTSMFLIDYMLVGVVFGLGAISLVIVIVIMGCFAFNLTTQGESIVIIKR